MSTIVTRAGKGSALTNTEVDSNFTNLNTDKIEAATTATLTNKTINLTSNTLVATSAQILAAVTDETGTGSLVFATSPTLVTPALGTPASGIVTNLTGTASININGTVGATTATTGAFTTVTATSSVTTDASFSARSSGTSAGVFASGLQIGGSGNDLVIYGQKAGNILLYPNATLVGNFSTTGLAVTGALSASTTLGVTGVATFSAGTAALPAITTTGDTNTGIFFPAADTIAFTEGGAEAMRIDSSGNVGIGTSSPLSRIDARSVAGELGRFAITNSGVGYLLIGGGSSTTEGLRLSYDNSNGSSNINNFYNAALLFSTNNTERARIDASGNLGLGVTPAAWALSGQKVFQVLNGSLTAYTTDEATVTGNAYHNGSGWRYIATNFAQQYSQQGGKHMWFNAASGTAGNAITFTQAMTLDTSGYLMVGTTTAATTNAVLTLYNPSATSSQIYLQNTGTGTGSTNGFRLLMSATDVYMTNKENGPIIFETNDAERMRISATGAFGIGTSSPTNPLEVSGTSRFFVAGQGDITISHSGLVSTIQAASSVSLALGANAAERFRIGTAGQLGIGGATYGTAGQVLTSGGASAAPTWSTPSGISTGKAIAMAIVFGG